MDEIKVSAKNNHTATKKKSEKRKRNPTIQVRVTEEERRIITENAQKGFGITPQEMFRQVGMGFEPKSIVDQARFIDLMKFHKDINRVGGLIKLWLSEREDKLPSDCGVSITDLQGLVGELRSASNEIKNAAGKLWDNK